MYEANLSGRVESTIPTQRPFSLWNKPEIRGCLSYELIESRGESCTEASEWCPSVCAQQTNRGSGLRVILLM